MISFLCFLDKFANFPEIRTLERGIAVESIILPFLHEMEVYRITHSISLEEKCKRWIINHPFIPPSYNGIVAEILWNILNKNWIAALAVLRSYINAFIREILRKQGRSCLYLAKSSEGIYEECYSFSRMLKFKELQNVFSDNLIFEIKELFHKKFGYHKSLGDMAFSSADGIYACWLFIHLLYITRSKYYIIKPKMIRSKK
jgi:hypothetical protein